MAEETFVPILRRVALSGSGGSIELSRQPCGLAQSYSSSCPFEFLSAFQFSLKRIA